MKQAGVPSSRMGMAGAAGLEPTLLVLETRILTIELRLILIAANDTPPIGGGL
jgi:hypothetical protein